MSTTTRQRLRLRAHFGISKNPFAKKMWARHMFDSGSQRDLLYGLEMWTEVGGIALVTGPSGVGKSITLRRFVQELDDNRFRVFTFSYLPSTVTGFLRSLCRLLGLPMRMHRTDLFDAVQQHLVEYAEQHGSHPILVIDDAEGLTAAVVDTLRRMTAYELDAEDRFSILIAGTDDVLRVIRPAQQEPLRSRISFAQMLHPFNLEDTRNYVRFHLERADANPKLISDAAVTRLFQASQGRPRQINQLALQAMIGAAVAGLETIDGDFMKQVIQSHPLYHAVDGVSP